MARRKRPGVVEGVTGLFDRTPEAWRALGAPPSLYDLDAAVIAYERCAQPGWNLAGMRSSTYGGHNVDRFAASRWWRGVRPHFLDRVGALTDAEQDKVGMAPRYYQLSHIYDPAAVERELFQTQGARNAVQR